MNNLKLHHGHQATPEEELARLSKVDFNASLPEGGADEMHEYLSLLRTDIRKMSKACIVSNVSFGGADGGGGIVEVAVQGERVDDVKLAHPEVRVRPLTDKEYFRALDHDTEFGPEAPRTGNPTIATPGRRAA